MKKPNITPGEWTIEVHRHVHSEVWLTLNRGSIDITHNIDRKNQIASQKYSNRPDGERIANAKAISAVPDMIDALIEARDEFQRINKKSMLYYVNKDRIEKIEKALKKAGVEL